MTPTNGILLTFALFAFVYGLAELDVMVVRWYQRKAKHNPQPSCEWSPK